MASQVAEEPLEMEKLVDAEMDQLALHHGLHAFEECVYAGMGA